MTEMVEGRCRRSAALCLLLAACGGPAADRAAPPIELVELARIDGGRAGFAAIAALEIDAAGAIYVLDRMDRLVHVFSDRGEPLRTFGGPGRGPGELQEPTALLWGPDGRLWVADPGNGRFAVFDESGGPIATHRSTEGDILHPLAIGATDAGRLFTVTFEFGRLEQPSAILVESELSDGVVRLLRQVELPFVSWPAPFEQVGEGVMMVVPVPFAPEPAFQIDGRGGVWYASTADPWVQRWTPEGGAERRFGQEFAPQPVTAADRRRALDGPELEGLRAAGGAAAITRLEERIPAVKPHLRGFFVDDEANVWIMRTPSPDSGEASRIDVYGSGGTLRGSAHARLEVEPRPRVRGGLLAAVVRDELGVESVVVYRVGPGN
jgi:hypothetical protein